MKSSTARDYGYQDFDYVILDDATYELMPPGTSMILGDEIYDWYSGTWTPIPAMWVGRLIDASEPPLRRPREHLEMRFSCGHKRSVSEARCQICYVLYYRNVCD